jgi:hypothetical protein
MEKIELPAIQTERLYMRGVRLEDMFLPEQGIKRWFWVIFL